MNSKQVGDISVSKILSKLLQFDFNVLFPWGDRNRYDLVAEKDNKFLKIQCKTFNNNGEVLRVQTYSLNTKNGKKYKDYYSTYDVDYFMIYCQKEDKVYLLKNSDDVKNSTQFRLIETKNKQIKRVKYAKDFEFNGKFS